MGTSRPPSSSPATRCYLLGTAGTRRSPPAGAASILLLLSLSRSISVDASSPPFHGGFCLVVAAGDALSPGRTVAPPLRGRRTGEGAGGCQRREVGCGLGGRGRGGLRDVFSSHGRMELGFGKGTPSLKPDSPFCSVPGVSQRLGLGRAWESGSALTKFLLR